MHISSVFPLMSIFRSGTHSRIPHCVYYVFLGISYLGQFLAFQIFHCLIIPVRYFVVCLSIWVYLIFFSWLDWCYAFWARVSQKWRTFLCASDQRVHDIDVDMPHWSTVNLNFSLSNIWGEILWSYAKLLFLLKYLPTNCSVHRWVLPAAIITVVF